MLGFASVVMLADRISVIQRSRTLESWIRFSSLIIVHLGLCSRPRQDCGYPSAPVESAAPTLGRRTASGCACQRHGWTTRSRIRTIPDGGRLLITSEAAEQLGVSVRTVEGLVAASRHAYTPVVSVDCRTTQRLKAKESSCGTFDKHG